MGSWTRLQKSSAEDLCFIYVIVTRSRWTVESYTVCTDMIFWTHTSAHCKNTIRRKINIFYNYSKLTLAGKCPAAFTALLSQSKDPLRCNVVTRKYRAPSNAVSTKLCYEGARNVSKRGCRPCLFFFLHRGTEKEVRELQRVSTNLILRLVILSRYFSRLVSELRDFANDACLPLKKWVAHLAEHTFALSLETEKLRCIICLMPVRCENNHGSSQKGA